MFLVDVDLSRARRDLNSKDETKAEMARAEMMWRQSRSVMSLPPDIRENEEQNLRRMNVYVAKQRNGPTGDCALVMVKPWMRFIDAYTEGEQTLSQAASRMESQEEFGEGMP
jgi:replicative DNA helicase